MPKVVSIAPTANFIVFSGTRERGARTSTPATTTKVAQARLPTPRSEPAAVAAEADNDERHLETLEEHSFERERERVPVEADALLAPGKSGPLELTREDRVLVMERLEATRAQDRLRSHCRPKASSRAPTTTRSPLIGINVKAGPSTPTITVSAAAAAPAPISGDRQPRVVPTASTIVSASTISTAQATNAARKRIVNSCARLGARQPEGGRHGAVLSVVSLPVCLTAPPRIGRRAFLCRQFFTVFQERGVSASSSAALWISRACNGRSVLRRNGEVRDPCCEELGLRGSDKGGPLAAAKWAVERPGLLPFSSPPLLGGRNHLGFPHRERSRGARRRLASTSRDRARG